MRRVAASGVRMAAIAAFALLSVSASAGRGHGGPSAGPGPEAVKGGAAASLLIPARTRLIIDYSRVALA